MPRFFHVPLLFVLLLALPVCAQPDASCDVVERSVTELQAAMADGTCTARQITEAYLARIESIDRSGPTLRSVLTVNPDALEIADALRRGAGSGHRARPAPRHPRARQGQRRHGGPDADDGGLARARRGDRAARTAHHRRAAARGGRRHPREGEPQRVGQLPLDELVVSGWSGAAGRRRTRTCSTARRAGRARAPARRSRRASPPSASAPRPTARWCARRRRTASSASSRRSGS